MSIDWISIEERVPDTRRPVIAWGDLMALGAVLRKGRFMVTRFNPGSSGGKWDCMHGGWSWFRVSHWADVEGPAENASIEPDAPWPRKDAA